MRHAILRRRRSGEQGTLGVLDVPGLPPIHVMEPPWRGNRRNRSCIPAGLYEVVPHLSPRHRRCLLVTQVPGRSHILFHAGNLGGDVERGWHTHTSGCLLPGLRQGRMTVDGRRQRAVLASRTAFRRLMDWAGDRPFALEIVAPSSSEAIGRHNVTPSSSEAIGRRNIAPSSSEAVGRQNITPEGVREIDHA